MLVNITSIGDELSYKERRIIVIEEATLFGASKAVTFVMHGTTILYTYYVNMPHRSTRRKPMIIDISLVVFHA